MFHFLNKINYKIFFIKNKRSRTPYNYSGKICIRHMKKTYPKKIRLFNKYQIIQDIPGFVVQKFNDYFLNKEYALIYFLNGFIHYILNIEKLPINYLIYNNSKSLKNVSLGSSFFLKKYPIGSLISNIEFIPNQGQKLCTSSGLYAKIIKHTVSNYTIIQLARKKKIKDKFIYKYLYLHSHCLANFGIVIGQKKKKNLIKAGDTLNIRKRRPKVRGVAMNPVDHPHGGGEGKTSGGRPSSTPWGIYCKGYKTSNKRERTIRKNKLRKLFSKR